ncbi:CheY-like chemotaxis protein [Sinobacterium caligoides]|uniref:CheY-like chemotaxis protein n=1 Tax=Sinobacterium caligoides TaxID=933926 RepID=A0A3N2DGZ7_9GAMM|nr:response regulator [Sinobacterium caligoides]ROR99065.1 CheY-like chemotaxis protein [Sinobacterium caligoides]
MMLGWRYGEGGAQPYECILLVEDTLSNRQLTQMILQQAGFLVELASSGEEAVVAAYNKRYELILMDCVMPGMDGYQATERIRREGGCSSRVPIIALTANTVAGVEEVCREAGMNGVLSKPLELTRLRDLLPGVFRSGEASVSADMTTYVQRPHCHAVLASGQRIGGLYDRLGVARFELLRRTTLASLELLIQELLLAHRCDDRALLQRLLHSLKSSVANYGADELVTLAQQLEYCCLDQALSARQLQQLQHLLQQFTAALADYRR